MTKMASFFIRKELIRDESPFAILFDLVLFFKALKNSVAIPYLKSLIPEESSNDFEI
jgi:hypothetical protein